MVRGRDERGSSGCLWFVFPGEMPSKWECLFLNEGIMTSRERFVLGALGHVGPELGALLPGSCRGSCSHSLPVGNLAPCWISGERLLQDFLFSPMLSFLFFPVFCKSKFHDSR